MPAQDPPADVSILIVEDEQDLAELLRYNLAREGYRVTAVGAGEDGLREARATSPSLILLDLMLPGMNGLEVCRALKSRPATADIPIIMLTARGEESDIVRGLEAGADDYIAKPFSPRVLMARIQAVLRRPRGEQPSESATVIACGNITIDRERYEVMAAGSPVYLTHTEFKMLVLLASRPGRVFTRKQVLERLHEGFAAVTDRAVDVQVAALRKKLGTAGDRIETVRGVGYRMREA